MIGLATIALWPGMTWESIGFKMPKRESWKDTIQFLFNAVIILLVASIVLIVFFDQSAIDLTLDQRSATRTFETFLYYLVVPALEEELVFRGLLWILIAKALPRKENITGKNYNWNFIVTTFMFATIHDILFDAQLNFVFDPLMIILTGLGGAYFGIIREKSDSLFPSMIMHNGFHLVTFLVPGLVQLLLT
ncbi:hypothetical protein C7K38_00070 [Tetragenococcus osmophilus]|uniref:CAAX prenyl protease 2/Lysostaphin resistance protein A-like domain-containing protein n=2 Tax=Tetragenococcus osmophilus TaxID=526944 RepID=A0ABM7A5T1_9ENTE|nr:CPBP family intramembrane glutamic endopeptidase [Tetragenococcus osmophilus]AYW46902.1 hypothetical protein C7K38_00070 [Tetragenococcus osmophilus]GMA54925.1 hypothetical protein GCM10025857_62820 [Alicyclobacillus contaminans]